MHEEPRKERKRKKEQLLHIKRAETKKNRKVNVRKTLTYNSIVSLSLL